MMNKVLYEELNPDEFRARIKSCPVAYLPLGTLEWHGEHMPLGADGIQSQGFFVKLAEQVGGIVLPKLFLGPDRRAGDLFGMDTWVGNASSGGETRETREPAQLDGSAYWVSDELFKAMIEAILTQLKRAGFRLVVAHGHGPSTLAFMKRTDEWEKEFDLRLFHCFGSPWDGEGKGIQVDHGAANETSLTMALRPELVDLNKLSPASWPVAVGGKDPRVFASQELGDEIIQLNVQRMSELIRGALG
ncbi:MAG: creatininase family protein [Clostridia bacterium]